MQKKIKKMFYKSVVGLASVAILSTAVISCSKKKGFDQQFDNKIQVLHTFSATGKHTEALNALIEKYNQVMANDPNFIPVQASQLDGGYAKSRQEVETKLISGDSTGFYNLVINYPDLVATLKNYDMNLNFADEDPNLNVDTSVFADQFNKINTDSEQLIGKGIWAIPANKSGFVLSVNSPVFAYVYESAMAQGAKVDPQDKEYFENFVKRGQSDKVNANNDKTWEGSEIEKIWGKPVDSGSFKDYVFKKSLFESYQDLIDFSNKVALTFPESTSTKEIDGKIYTAEGVLGVDTVANVIYSIAYSLVEGDDSKFIFNNTKTKSVIDFDSAFQQGSPEYENLKKSYEILRSGLPTKAVKILDDGDYASNYQKFHKMLFGLGSTSGYSFNYAKAGANKSLTLENKSVINGNFLSLIKGLKPKKPDGKDQKAGFLSYIQNGRYTNTIFKSTAAKEDVKNFDIQLSSPEVDAFLEAKLNGSPKTNPDFYGFISSESSIKDLIDKDKSLLASNGGQITILGKDHRNITFYYIDAEKSKFATGSDSATMQENELVTRIAPYKADSSRQKNVILAQGPSLIGIHANEKEDKGTKAFVKWLLTGTIDEISIGKQGEEIKYTNQSPISIFGTHSSYLIPTKEFFENPVSVDKGKAPENKKELPQALDEAKRTSKSELERIFRLASNRNNNKVSAVDTIQRSEAFSTTLPSQVKTDEDLQKLISSLPLSEGYSAKFTLDKSKAHLNSDAEGKIYISLSVTSNKEGQKEEKRDFYLLGMGKTRLNAAVQVLANAFRKTNDEPEQNVIYQDPIDLFSPKYRDSINNIFLTQAKAIRQNPNVANQDFEAFVENVKQKAKSTTQA
ncbi:P68 family surface lipoprotein [Mycoplasmopsis pulmonis]|uniref:P68 family surface lipoprotein n=1 Tax=Mycoplasmopsis pulmonis TaxID=2107 RepID=UPI002ACDEB21|nr:P80 family lipoprotein [Mycoplasmopsis pulmonis]MDZ7293727.1 P80 family lipoprotein [Mycoplasmopsis pulmonis]